MRWKIELLHREIKEVTGCVCMTRADRRVGKTIFDFKGSLLDDYLRHQLSNPSIIFKNA